MIINGLSIRPGEGIEKVLSRASKKSGKKVHNWRILKESIDARNKADIRLVYSLEINYDPNEAKVLEIPKAESKERPVVVGFGPCGIFAGLVLARAGMRPVILERGDDVDRRLEKVRRFGSEGILDTESNVQFGEGGAGTFSDGKLTTGIKDHRMRFVLEELAAHGGPEDILYKAKPHIGTDVLREVVKSLRKEIIALGGQVIFGARVKGIDVSDNRVKAVEYSVEGRTERLETDDLILAIGHSSRDTLLMLKESGFMMVQKPFSMGVRVEHPQELIDVAQYGRPAGELKLPPADYKLSYRTGDGRGVYTFCMCPGGHVIVASSEEGGVTTNGMSFHGRDSGFANSAVLCDLRPADFGSDDVLAGMYLQRKYERIAYQRAGGYHAPRTDWRFFREGLAPDVTDCMPGFVADSIREAMPAFGRRVRGFDSDDTAMYAVEARSSSPVRLLRDEGYRGGLMTGETIEGFYPSGEGAGYAGGIVSAAVDGIRSAMKIIEKYR
ncbi:MAG: NAD(FAD)-utilizing dehydrogenase [Firmicutes bacterium]|nr:NAD(FAD)-utilizing dehydrogenase [Bacillota bacterium]